MPSTLLIRFADIDDINTIGFLAQQIGANIPGNIIGRAAQLHDESFYSPASLRNQMVQQKHVFIILEDNESPVGFASYSATSIPSVYKLHKIYVLPSQQGKDLGKTIIDFITDDIKQQNAVALQLNVNRNNKARTFYERLGFTVIKEEDIDIGNDYFMNDYIMERSLS